MDFYIYNSSEISYIVLKLTRLATKGFNSQVDNHLIIFTDVYYIAVFIATDSVAVMITKQLLPSITNRI